MSVLTLTKTRLLEGIWEGVLAYDGGEGPSPSVDASFLGKPVPDCTVDATETPGTWLYRVPIPTDALSDGVQTIVITDTTTGEKLEAISFVAGEALADDLRAELDLLRAELDMLKRAFRRHCVETT